MRFIFFLLLIFNFSKVFALDLPQGGNFAAKIINLEDNSVKFEHNADSLMIPASTQKVITLFSALKLLDVNDSFKTSLYYDGDIKDGTLNGNLYFKFSGDPKLTTAQLAKMVEVLKARGVIRIGGHIVIDDLEFDDENFGHGWSIDQTKFCYSAPVSSMIIDGNCVNYDIGITTEGLNLSPKQQPIFAKLHDNSKRISEVDESCEFELKAFSDNTYVLHGCYVHNGLPKTLQMAIQNPKKNAIEVISHLLDVNNIKYDKIVFGKVSDNINELSYVKSKPLIDLLYDMMIISDNMIAEAIFKRISSHNNNSGGWKNSVKAVNKMLQSELSYKNFPIIKDGSGISRKNLISPNHFVDILKSAYKDQILAQKFLNSFPFSGKDMNLNKRFKDTELENAIYAKSGSMDNVSTLVGYAFMPTGEKYAFSMMFNNVPLESWEVKNIENKILTNLLTNKK